MNEDALTKFTVTAERAANEVIAGYSTSFHLACRMLGPRHRQHVRNIYALVRVADEIVDGVTTEAGLSAAEQSESLERLVTETHRAIRLGASSDLVVHAFARTAQAARIDESLTEPFFNSMRTDLTRQEATLDLARFSSEEHADYVYGSAEVVGLMCLRVFLRDHILDESELAQAEHGARQLGAAFQNINFLRDLADDTERLGRSYLGAADRLEDEDRIRWLGVIREQLDDAHAAIRLLPADARVAVRSALFLFRALTDRLDAVGIDELYRRRVRVSNSVKAALAARAVVTSWWEPRT